MITTHRINLVVDEKMEEILSYFRSQYPLLKDVDLIKMAVSGYYSNNLSSLPIHILNEEENTSLQNSIATSSSQDPVFDNTTDLMNYLNSSSNV